MDLIRLDENHVYWLGDKRLPGVTETLGIFSDFSRIPKDVLEHKRMLGRAVHKAIELYEAGTLDDSTLDDEVLGYLEGWIKLKADKPFRVIAAEEIVYSKKYGYAGRLDLNAALEKDVWQLDLKCVYDMAPETALQTAAYSQAWNETHEQQITKRAGVQLLKEGKYLFHPYTKPENRHDLNIFLNALNLRNWLNNRRKT